MIRNPCNIIKIDKYTNRIQFPDLLLMTRSFEVIGKISRYRDWSMSLRGNDIDEIFFTVVKYVNGVLNPVWDDLVDLKVVEVRDFGRFEITVNYTDETKTEKAVHGKALEIELSQIPLYEFHVNDEDAMSMEITEYNKSDFDEHGNFIPTVFYDASDPKHSLLHRVIADKAPHWRIGYVTKYIALSEDVQPESSNTFQRTYTSNGTTIYDLLTGDIAKESNVVFIFDTIHREINCYSLCDCIDQETGELLEHGIGEDTTILISKRKLANEISITSNKDNVKNCFRIEGGDDVITDMVRVANINGSNYIYQFADFQYKDMPEELADRIKSYYDELSRQSESYYGENGIYTKLCKKYDDLAYYESAMMPDVSIKETTAEEQYRIMVRELTGMVVGVSSLNNYNNNLFLGVSNNIEAMANILIDSRYKAKIIENSASYNSSSHEWRGNIQLTRAADETDYYPKTSTDITSLFSVTISDDETVFISQKIDKALSKGSMLDIDFDVKNMSEAEMKSYFGQYGLNRLKSFYDGYNSCLSVLMSLNTSSSTYKELYAKYYTKMTVVETTLKERQSQVDSINSDIDKLLKEQADFQETWDFQKYLGEDLYKIFCSYRREDMYTNNNYISDGLSTSECVSKAKELIDAATEEIKKACVLQRTVTTNLNNLFALPEFEPLYEKFALFNYVRIRTEDEILKLRLIGIDFNGDSVNEITVTFSEQIESVDGKMSDLRSIIKQASSMSTSFPSTALQAKKGAQARDIFGEIYNKGLNAAKTMLSNNDSNEVTVTSAGIIGKRMDDEGYYGDKQFRITGNMFAFTKDNWRNVELAIGETYFYNPISQRNELQYGILASALVGRVILGENLGIYSKNNALTFDANGLCVTNDVNTFSVNPDSGTLLSLSNSNGKVLYVDESGELHIKGNGNALDISANSTVSNLLSRITQTANEINLEVSKKVGNDEIISKINQSAEQVSIKAGKIKLEGYTTINGKFKVNLNGSIEATDGTFSGTGTFKEGFSVNVNTTFGQWIMEHNSGGVKIGLDSNSDDAMAKKSNITFDNDGINLFCNNGSISLYTGNRGSITLTSSSGINLNGPVSMSSLDVTNNATIGGNATIDGSLKVNNKTLPDISSIAIVNGHNLMDHTITRTNPAKNFRMVRSDTSSEGNAACVIYVNDNFEKKSSDERVKHNFSPLPSCINNIFDSFNPMQYKYKEGLNKKGYQFGETAQNIERILEELGLDYKDYGLTGTRIVDSDSGEDKYIPIDDEFHYIDINNIVWMCVDQIQKLKKKMAELENKMKGQI